jgi:nitrogen fixation NifU-like protein
MYSARVLDHFQHPRNAGELPGADADVEAQNPACGDILRLAAKRAGEKLTEVRFLARGCTASIAAGSAITELLQGRTLADARNLRREQVVEALDGLPNESMHATYLAMDAVKALLNQLELRASPGGPAGTPSR